MYPKLFLSLAFLCLVVFTFPSAVAFDQPPASDHDPHAQIPPGVAARMAAMAAAGSGDSNELPKFDDISKDFTKVVSTTDGAPPMYNMWIRERDAQILIELPSNFERQDLFIAYTITGGIPFAGVQFGDMYAKWKRYDRRVALIEPNFHVRTTGDPESKRGHERVFTDRVILDMPIAAQGPSGGIVINATDWLLGNATTFFGQMGRFNRQLAQIATSKSFPRNIEVGYEIPQTGTGRLVNIHYSISILPPAGSTGYKPRHADNRVGYFTTTYRDIGDASKDIPWVRYINRWHLEKADSSLKLSPPKQPIVFYIEHTTPVRYRRWVREGVLEWNKAFEKVGIINAIEVYQQDARTGAHMDKDPADARYNFVLWTNAGMGFAIGPSRVDPRTGQILDADVVLDEGFITSWAMAWRQLIPEIAMEGFDPETYAWLETRPQWDPRVRLAAPGEREDVIRALTAQRAKRGIHRFGAHPAAMANTQLLGTEQYDGLYGRVSQVNGMCMHALAKSLDLAMFRLGPELFEELASFEVETRTIPDNGISGTWEGAVMVPNMDAEVAITLNLTRHSDDNVSGTAESVAGAIDVSGRYDPSGNRLTLSGSTPETGSIDFDLRVSGESMSGTVRAMGERFDITFRRTSRPATTEYVVVTSEERAQRQQTSRDDDNDEPKNGDEPKPSDPKPETPPSDKLDGIPEWFVGPLLRDLTMHEIGHTLGLRHNFKASGIYSLEEINSPEHEGVANSGSVMDYNPININFGDGPVQGDYAIMTIGPYDYWAIEYGYTFGDTKKVLERVSDPKLAYATDEDTWGPDPMARRFDFGSNPLDYSESQMRLVKHLRTKLLDRVVKDGESWSRARRGYEILLGRHFGSVSIAANWIGGSTIHRDHKGDPGDRKPIENISAEQQRRALTFVIDNAFKDDAFGLTEELLKHMTVDKWWDAGGFNQIFEDPTWPVHDRIMSIQASALTMVLNPTTLRRVFDNEFRVASNEDALTLPEVLFGISDAVFAEIDAQPARRYTARDPMISSLRRNLQTELLKRLIDLSLPNESMGIAAKPISNLSVYKLREIKDKIDGLMNRSAARLDPYTLAHLDEARVRIEKALDAQYIYNTDAFGTINLNIPFMFMQENDGAPQPR